mgnify:FL=1
MAQEKEPKGEVKGAKPDVVLRGRNGTFLSIWLSGNKLKVSVTRRGEDGRFERVDDYVVNLDYILFVAIRKGSDSRAIVGNVCDMLESLAEESEGSE